MKINDIEYFVALWIGDLESVDLKEFYFADFDEFNEFIKDHQNDPQYDTGPFNYTLVESVDGKPTTDFFWNREIQFVPFTKEQIFEEIETQIEFLEDIQEMSKEMERYMKEIHYTEPAENYKEKTERLKDFAYVCPRCIREVEDCRCKHYPYYLMQIDRKILPIIRELNMKGFKTTGCCAGHPKEGDPYSARVYICFDKAYAFDEPLPEGAVWSKIKNSIEFEPECSSYEELAEFQQECLYKLSDWAEMLFEPEEKE